MKPRHSVYSGRKDKQLSFITFLNGSDDVVFKRYEGIPPSNWDLKEDDVLYYLEACQPVKAFTLNTISTFYFSIVAGV